MSLYKYVKFNDLKRILEGTIRFTQPGAFNDPFEMVPRASCTGYIWKQRNQYQVFRYSAEEGPDRGRPGRRFHVGLL